MFKVTTATPAPAAGQLYKDRLGNLRMLVETTDGRQAVINPAKARLLGHEKLASGKRKVFTSWADRIAADGYAYVGSLELA